MIDGNHVSAHVDRVCPLDLDPHSPAHYSWAGVLGHNLSGMAGDAVRLLGWRPHRCDTGCAGSDIEEQSITDLVAARVAGRRDPPREPGPEDGSALQRAVRTR